MNTGKSGFLKAPGTRVSLNCGFVVRSRMDAQFGRFCVPEERALRGALPMATPRKMDLPRHTGLRVRQYHCDKPDTRNWLTALPGPAAALVRRRDRWAFRSERRARRLRAAGHFPGRVHYGALYVAECKYRSRSGRVPRHD